MAVEHNPEFFLLLETICSIIDVGGKNNMKPKTTIKLMNAEFDDTDKTEVINDKMTIVFYEKA